MTPLASSPMKLKFLSLLAGVLLAPLAANAADFEGRVGFKMTGNSGRAQEVNYALKNGKIRIEIPGQQGMGAMIMDPAKKETTVIMDQQRMYMTMAVPDAQPQGATGQDSAPTLEKTGQTEKILGHTAEKYISTHQGEKTELWLAEGLGAFMGFSNPNPMGSRRGGNAASAQAWERALAGKQLFPLRVVGRDKADKETFRLEVTSIDKQTLSDDLFAPPAGYQKLDMGNMMQGMMPGGMKMPGSR